MGVVWSMSRAGEARETGRGQGKGESVDRAGLSMRYGLSIKRVYVSIISIGRYREVSCRVLLCHVMSCRVIGCHVVSCYVMSYRDVWWDGMGWGVVWCGVVW